MACRSTGGRAVVVALVMSVMVASCSGGNDDEPGARPGAADAAWRVDTLAPVADSRGGASVVVGDRVVVLAPTSAGALEPWTSVGGAPFEPGSPVPRGSDGLFVTAAAATAPPGPVRAIAVGIDLWTLTPLVFLSGGSGGEGGPDHRWEEVDTTGMDAPADPSAVAATAERFVVVGIRRTGADQISGPYQPTAWSSADGRSWTEAALPAAGEGFASGVAVVGGEVVAVGPAAGPDALWRSGDGGLTWEREGIEVEGVGRSIVLVDIAAVGDSVVALGQSADSAGPADPMVMRSVDGGRRWTAVSLGDSSTGGQAALALVAEPAGFSIVTDRFLEAAEAADRCYRDVEGCRDPRPVVLRSATGEAWDEVDVGAAPGLFRVDRAHEGASGDIVLVGVDTGGSTAVWTWPAEAGPAPSVDPAPPTTPAEPLVTNGDDLDAEVTYRFPLGGHCGRDYLGELDGSHWYVDELRGPTASPGPGDSLPEHWPVAGEVIYGYLTLTADDTIEYSIPGGEVIGVYTRSDRQPPDCR